MKLSIILPVYAASVSTKQKNEDEVDQDRSVTQNWVTEECSEQVSKLGGSFEATNIEGFLGTINLDQYPNDASCKHLVRADSRCKEIIIKYRSVAVESTAYSKTCHHDSFQFVWFDEVNDSKVVTPARCRCFGEGCVVNSDWFDDSVSSYVEHYEDYYEEQLGPTEYSVISNSFTFIFN